jgi:ABC-type amino acid transport system permease subunit
MSWYRTARKVILPQSLVYAIPPFGSRLINLINLTSLASLVTVHDLTFQAQTIRTNIGHTVTIYGTTLVMYVVLCLLVGWIVRRLEIKAVRSVLNRDRTHV